jgi:hypothetical protein
MPFPPALQICIDLLNPFRLLWMTGDEDYGWRHWGSRDIMQPGSKGHQMDRISPK